MIFCKHLSHPHVSCSRFSLLLLMLLVPTPLAVPRNPDRIPEDQPVPEIVVNPPQDPAPDPNDGEPQPPIR